MSSIDSSLQDQIYHVIRTVAPTGYQIQHYKTVNNMNCKTTVRICKLLY